MKYRDIEKRLAQIEQTARLAERARIDAWLESLTDDELHVVIEQHRRSDPEAWARTDAMTLSIFNWAKIRNQLAIRFEGRFPL